MQAATVTENILTRTLAQVCHQCPHLSDEVIDLHLGVQRRCTPGRCAKALFRVVSEAGKSLPTDIWGGLRKIQEELVVEAYGADGLMIERLAFVPLEDEDLEAYCRRMMDLFVWDRKPVDGPLRLQFSYA